MKKLIDNWKQYILKNHPVMWMSGLHLIIPMLVPVLILGYLWGYSNDFTSSLESTYIVGLVIGAILLITIIAWQYFRFMKELSFLQLTKYFIFCIVIYFATIITAFSPLKGFHEKLEKIFSANQILNSEAFASTQISKYKTYIFAKGLKPFYDAHDCYFKEWHERKFIDIYWTDTKMPIISYASCEDRNKSFEAFIFSITKTISELNFDDPLINAINDLDGDGVLDVYDLCMEQFGSADLYGCPENNVPSILDSTIEVLRDRIQTSRNFNQYYETDQNFRNSIEYIIKATEIVLDNGLDILEYELNSSQVWPPNFVDNTDLLVAHGAEYQEQKQEIADVFREIQSNAYSNDRFIRDDTLLYTMLILLVVVSIISSLIVTSRFKVEAMLSPLLGFILWLVYIFLMEQFLDLRGDDIYSFIVIGPSILIVAYWIRNSRIKSITVFRSLLLHMANLSFITVLCFVWVWNDDVQLFGNEFELAIILAVLAFLFNIFFLRQYHRHMHLPIKTK